MKTGIDTFNEAFFDSITFEGGLKIKIIEGIKGNKPEPLQLGGKVIHGTFPVNINTIYEILV